MKVVFLGTGTSQGVPVIACDCEICRSENSKDKRTRTSVLIETNGKHIVVDTGPDFRQQMLREQVSRLDVVLITHQHRDHIAGLDDVRSFNFKQNKSMPVYGNVLVVEQIKREFHYAFAKKKYPGAPEIDLRQINDDAFIADEIPVTPIEVWHHKLPVFGYRIQDFTYITDANFISDHEKEKIKNSKILVINALQKEPHRSHFNFEQALGLIEEMKPESAYLTHIGHRMGFHDEVMLELPDHVHLAYDGLELNL